jgi:rhodanese-related sulfurtransferase
MMRIFNKFALSVLAISFSLSTAFAGEWDNLPAAKQTKAGLYMHTVEAYKFTTDNKDKVLFLDVRTKEEVQFLGMATVADANVPYLQNSDWFEWNDKSKNFKLVPNNSFAAEVERRILAKGLTKNDPIILMCRSGDRSSLASNLLTDLGFKKVYTVVEGYEGDVAKDGPNKGRRVVNGWKNEGLPWTYDLDKTKMYGSAS